YGDGKIIFVPPAENEHYQQYLVSLKGLPSLITRQQAVLPEWAAQFQTDAEQRAKSLIAKLTEEIAPLKKKIQEQEAAIGELSQLKQLFAGSGDEFKDAVALALTELGLKVADGPYPRADLLATDGTNVSAIEAKGLEGSARESNLAQALRWRAEVNSTFA